MHINFKSSALLFSIVLISSLASAQENNVLTRFGIGELKNPSSANLRGWGGLSCAYNSNRNYNNNNPAALGYLKMSTFQFAAFGDFLSVKTNSASGKFGYSSPEYLSLAVPLKKNKAGLALGLQSMSRVNYDIRQINDTSEFIGSSFNAYTGSGGTYKVFLASGIRIKNLSLGLKANYLFGTLKYVNILFLTDSAVNAYYSRSQESKSFGALILEGGIQFQHEFKNKNRLSLGANGNLQSNLSAHHDLLFERLFYANSVLTANDTVYNQSDVAGDVILPMQIGVGFIFSKMKEVQNEKWAAWSVGAQVNYGSWSNYKSFGEVDSSVNKLKISIGAELNPGKGFYDSYFKNISYRIGGYTGVNYISLNGNNVSEKAITLGLGLPVRRNASELNLSFDVGTCGNLSQNNLQQFFVKGTFAITLSDFWFVKRKFE